MQMTKAGHVVRALTIAGSDSGGGAGIQADLKTFAAFSVYGTSVITALTAQNTLGVQGVQYAPASFVGQQLDSVFDDIGADAVKTGMLGSADIIDVVCDTLSKRSVQSFVVDPVMVAKGGESLLDPDAVSKVKHRLLPFAAVVTPNIPEAEVLCGAAIQSWADCHQAAREIWQICRSTVVIKGGHAQAQWSRDTVSSGALSQPALHRLADCAVDVVYDGEVFTYFVTPRVDSRKTHGTGCTFSAAIAASLAGGRATLEAIAAAKTFIYRAIASASAWDVGTGHGPTNHSVQPVFASNVRPGLVYEWQENTWVEITGEK